MKKSFLRVNIEFFLLKQGNKYVAYAPALDMSTCGNTYEQVHKRAMELIDIFVEETTKHGTLWQALQELGWRVKVKHGQKTWIPPYVIGQTPQVMSIPLSS